MKINRTLLIGLDAAEWNIINPLIAVGMLPNIQKLLNQGVRSKIKTLQPAFSPLLWTSIATGKTADKHGILGFVEPDYEKGMKPISNSSRTTRAVWNILHHKGLKSNVVSWWPSHPVEPINGAMISNKIQEVVNYKHEPWPIPVHAVHGVDETVIASLRVHPEDIGIETLRTFIPNLQLIDQDKNDILAVIRTLLAKTITTRNITQYLIQNTNWDLTAVYFNELDIFSHRYMMYHPPMIKGMDENEYNLFYNIITATYTFYDAIIGDLIDTAGEDSNIIILSDHGFKTGTDRIKKLPGFSADIALEHQDAGFLCMAGPSFKQNIEITGTTLLDITPTLLAVFGLPIGADMDGKIIQNALVNFKPLEAINSWDELEGDFAELDKTLHQNAFNEMDAIQHLIDLGYVAKSDHDVEDQINKVKFDTSYNLSQVLLDKGLTIEALEILEKLYEEDMVDIRLNLDLIKYHTELGNTDRARQILTSFKKFDISRLPNFDFLEGKIFIRENNLKEALESFKKALIDSPNYKDLLIQTGLTYNKLGKYKTAEKYFKKVLAFNETNVSAYWGLTIAKRKQGEYEKAVEYALEAINLNADNAHLHYQLGESLFHLENYEIAIQALENCLQLNPNVSRARNLVINIYKNHKPNKEKLSAHLKHFKATRKGEIVVVVGLERSGTSLMMQMLKASGKKLLYDENQQADACNLNGYYDYTIGQNGEKWIDKANGKVVKLFVDNFMALNMKYHLKVIYMERDLNEIILSQEKKKLLKMNKSTDKSVFDLTKYSSLSKKVKNFEKWAMSKNNLEVVKINYNTLLKKPSLELKKLNDFFDWSLDEEKMLNSIDPNLYQVKTTQESYV